MHKDGDILSPILLTSPEVTRQYALALARVLKPGDTLLLNGPVGAGKTHFARSIIHSLTDEMDIPSPTFTLVQTYEGQNGHHIWHTDLYRLSDISELEELGLTQALDQAIVLVEWAERLGALTPHRYMALEFTPDQSNEDQRHLSVTVKGGNWTAALRQLEHHR